MDPNPVNLGIYKHKGHRTCSVRSVLLFMPFDLVEYDDAVVLIPMTAPVNCRDVTSTLINDATAVDLLKFGAAHAIFGRVGNNQERFKHKMKPTFNGTAGYEGQSPFFFD